MTYAEFFAGFKSRFSDIDVSWIQEHLAYQFNIEDEEAGGIFYVEVKEGNLDKALKLKDILAKTDADGRGD